MDVEHFNDRSDARAHAGEQYAIGCQRAIEVENKRLKLARSLAGQPKDDHAPLTCLSAHELIDVIHPETARRVMVAAHVDLGEDILVAVLPAFVVEIDHCAAAVEE